MNRCECEHYSHFETTFRTPQGNVAHPYGALYGDGNMVSVKTPRGTFHVCMGCAEDCYAQWWEKQQLLNEMGHGEVNLAEAEEE